jgi:hypothetical protein
MPKLTGDITCMKDLPKANHDQRSSNDRRRCPNCGHPLPQGSLFTGFQLDLKDLAAQLSDQSVPVPPHCGSKCNTCFGGVQSNPTAPDCQHTRRAIRWALRLVREEGSNHRGASWRLYCEHQVFVPAATIKNWIKASRGKGQ